MSNFASELEATFVIDYIEIGSGVGDEGRLRDVPTSAIAATH
jgi:hypothetical protein